MKIIARSTKSGDIGNSLNKCKTFKQIVEKDCIDMFWKSRVGHQLKPRPEEIGHGLLYVYLSAIGVHSSIISESRTGVGKSDLLLISESGKSIIEIKIVKSKRDINTGIRELIYYTDKERLDEGYLVLFDTRKTISKKESKIKRDGKTIKITSIKIYEEAPSKVRNT